MTDCLMSPHCECWRRCCPHFSAHFILFLSDTNNARPVLPPVSERYCICSHSRTHRGNIQSTVKSYMLQKWCFRGRVTGNIITSITLQCSALVICWIMFISYSLKQVVANLWRITLWIISALSDVVWNGFSVPLSAVDVISWKMEKSLKQYSCIYIYVGNHPIWNEQPANGDSLQNLICITNSTVKRFVRIISINAFMCFNVYYFC